MFFYIAETPILCHVVSANSIVILQGVIYCKSQSFRENFIFANSVKRHICDVKNSRQGHDLPISVDHGVIWAFGEDFIFTKLCIC